MRRRKRRHAPRADEPGRNKAAASRRTPHPAETRLLRTKGFSRGTQGPALKRTSKTKRSSRSAEALLPRMNGGLPTERSHRGLASTDPADVRS